MITGPGKEICRGLFVLIVYAIYSLRSQMIRESVEALGLTDRSKIIYEFIIPWNVR